MLRLGPLLSILSVLRKCDFRAFENFELSNVIFIAVLNLNNIFSLVFSVYPNQNLLDHPVNLNFLLILVDCVALLSSKFYLTLKWQMKVGEGRTKRNFAARA